MLPNPPPLLIGQLEGTNLALHASRSFHDHGSQAARGLSRPFKATYDSYIEGVIRLHLEPFVRGIPVLHNHAFAPGQATGIVDDGAIELHRVTALGHGGDNMEMPNEVIVEACLLGLVFVNIDLPKLAASPNLDDARVRVD